jgi:NADH-quinone oxidoreductase subunit N
MSMGPFAVILPEIVVLLSALAALFADVLTGGRRRAGAWIGAAGAALACVSVFATGQGTVPALGGMFVVDDVALFARAATTGLTAVYLLWLAGAGAGVGRARGMAGLALLSALGCMLMAGSRDWIVLFLALEVATMPLYMMLGSDRDDVRGLDGALTYFLMSIVASLVLLYGLSFVYGLSGGTAFSDTRLAAHGVLGVLAGVFVLTGLLAKLSAVPFHYRVPDAYEGASTTAVAFASSVPRIAGAVVLARVAGLMGTQVPTLLIVLAAAAVVSMLLGNLMAFAQKDMRRLMAYSGVGHAGYVVLAISTGSERGLRAAVLYALAYAVPSMAAMLVVAEDGPAMERLSGLAARRPWRAWAMTLLLLSLVGVPPLAGFFGKLYMFEGTLDAGVVALGVAIVVMSAVSAGYYLRVIGVMYFGVPDVQPTVDPSPGRATDVALALCVLAIVAFPFASSWVLAAIGLGAR